MNGTKVGSTSIPRYEVRGLACSPVIGWLSAHTTLQATGRACERGSLDILVSADCDPSSATSPLSSGGADLYVSLAGSDSRRASRRLRAVRSTGYHLAKSGSRVFLMSGDDGGQSLSYTPLWSARRTRWYSTGAGCDGTESGELSLRADAGKPIANVEMDNIAIDDIYVRYVEHVTFRNVAHLLLRPIEHRRELHRRQLRAYTTETATRSARSGEAHRPRRTSSWTASASTSSTTTSLPEPTPSVCSSRSRAGSRSALVLQQLLRLRHLRDLVRWLDHERHASGKPIRQDRAAATTPSGRTSARISFATTAGSGDGHDRPVSATDVGTAWTREGLRCPPPAKLC